MHSCIPSQYLPDIQFAFHTTITFSQLHQLRLHKFANNYLLFLIWKLCESLLSFSYVCSKVSPLMPINGMLIILWYGFFFTLRNLVNQYEQIQHGRMGAFIVIYPTSKRPYLSLMAVLLLSINLDYKMQWLSLVFCSETQIYWLYGGAVNSFSMLSSSSWHFNFGIARIFLYELYFEQRTLEHFYGSPLCELCPGIAETEINYWRKVNFCTFFQLQKYWGRPWIFPNCGLPWNLITTDSKGKHVGYFLQI